MDNHIPCQFYSQRLIYETFNYQGDSNEHPNYAYFTYEFHVISPFSKNLHPNPPPYETDSEKVGNYFPIYILF